MIGRAGRTKFFVWKIPKPQLANAVTAPVLHAIGYPQTHTSAAAAFAGLEGDRRYCVQLLVATCTATC